MFCLSVTDGVRIGNVPEVTSGAKALIWLALRGTAKPVPSLQSIFQHHLMGNIRSRTCVKCIALKKQLWTEGTGSPVP